MAGELYSHSNGGEVVWASAGQWVAQTAVPMLHSASGDCQGRWWADSSRLRANLWLLGGNRVWMGRARRLGRGAKRVEGWGLGRWDWRV